MKGMTLCLLMALAVTSGWMSAQVSTGKIEGQVSDSTGAMIQKAQVSISITNPTLVAAAASLPSRLHRFTWGN